MQAHGHPALKVGRDKQWKSGILLQTIEQVGGFEWLITIQKWRVVRNRHKKRADVIFAHEAAQLKIGGTLHIQELRAHPDHENLADFFFERKFL